MRENSVYCVNCDAEVNYITRQEKKRVVVKGREFEVTLTRAYCAECGEPVSPDAIAKANDLIVFDEYRKLEGLLTSEQIKAIRFKRGLSQVALARLINCGEKNIARYETGTIQDRAFDLLMRLVDDDKSYAVLKSKQMEKEENIKICTFVLVEGYSQQASFNWPSKTNEDYKCEYDYRKGVVSNGNGIKTRQILCNSI